MNRRAVKRQAATRLSDEDYVALSAFRLALRRFLKFSEAGAHTYGLTAQQHQALLAVRAHRGEEPMSIGELADSLLIKNHSAVGLVARLQARGLVVRKPSPGDRRRVLLAITPEAQGMLDQISRGNLDELKSNAEAFEALLSSLRRIDARAAAED
ncbi:MAG: MarR family transcriptional regulator [Alphaproteobacteria bacterium]|nr:MarR family transcriptional regulator [Alphaproteobacteria bacterium]